MASCDFEDDGSQEKQRRKSYGPRKLMRWDAEKDQLVLLTVDHVCAKKGIPIPWEEVAKEVSPNLSGEAIKQHLVKVRMYRIENDQQVPEKLEKGTRRKANLAAAANQATPVRGARAKKVKKEEAEEDATPTASKPRRGVSLLHMKESKNDKTSKVGDDTSTPSTTRRGGRKKAAGNDGLGEAAAVAAASTGKRGRKKKQAVENEEGEESNYEYDSPTKKPRTRAKPKVNYCEEQVEEDADEEVVPYDESNNDGKGAYETLRESHPHAATQDSFGPAQAGISGTLPFQPFQTSASFAQGLAQIDQQGVPVPNHAFSGMPMAYACGPSTLPANAKTYYTSDGFGAFHGHPPNPTGYYGGYAQVPRFNGELNDPRRQQDLRDAMSEKLAAVHEGDVKEACPPKKTPRKKAAPKASDTPKIEETLTLSTPKAATGDQTRIKVEAPAEASGDLYGQSGYTGTIPSTNHAGYATGIFDMGNNAGDIGVIEHSAYNGGVPMNVLTTPFHVNTSFDYANPASMTPIVTSSIDIFSNNPIDHTGVTPGMSNMGFDNSFYNGQLNHTTSHSSSFDSVNLSQSYEALPSIEHTDSTNFGIDEWDPAGYEMAMPGDEYANMGF